MRYSLTKEYCPIIPYRYLYDGGNLIRIEKGSGTSLQYIDFLYDGATLFGFRFCDVYTPINRIYYYLYGHGGNVEGILDAGGNVLVRYIYDAWGNFTEELTFEGQQNPFNVQALALNPFRYRGYVYDYETEFYYLQSRYYDPETGRFISADNADVVLASGMALTDKNLFAYCDNDPVNRTDETGEFWNFIIGGVVGAVAGLAGQIISDVVTSIATGEVTISNWQTYTGAVVGGAIGGVILGATGDVNVANAAAGFVTTGLGQTLEKLTIENYDKSWAEIGINAIVDGGISYGLGKVQLGIKKVTAGRNSWSAVYKSGLTKLRNGTASKMSTKVFAKGIGSSVVDGFALDGYYGVKQYAYDRIKNLF